MKNNILNSITVLLGRAMQCSAVQCGVGYESTSKEKKGDKEVLRLREDRRERKGQRVVRRTLRE